MNADGASCPTGPGKRSDKGPMQRGTVAHPARTGETATSSFSIARSPHRDFRAKRPDRESPNLPHEPRHSFVPNQPGRTLRQKPLATWHRGAPVRPGPDCHQQPVHRAPSQRRHSCAKPPNHQSPNLPHEPRHGLVPNQPERTLRQKPPATWHRGASVRRGPDSNQQLVHRVPSPWRHFRVNPPNRKSPNLPHEPRHSFVPNRPATNASTRTPCTSPRHGRARHRAEPTQPRHAGRDG
jgi:hypothetical protein